MGQVFAMSLVASFDSGKIWSVDKSQAGGQKIATRIYMPLAPSSQETFSNSFIELCANLF